MQKFLCICALKFLPHVTSLLLLIDRCQLQKESPGLLSLESSLWNIHYRFGWKVVQPLFHALWVEKTVNGLQAAGTLTSYVAGKGTESQLGQEEELSPHRCYFLVTGSLWGCPSKTNLPLSSLLLGICWAWVVGLHFFIRCFNHFFFKYLVLFPHLSPLWRLGLYVY